jgi:hypothetical protein
MKLPGVSSALLTLGLVLAGAVATPGAAAEKKSARDGGWRSLFDGQSLAGWAPSGFEGEGAVKLERPFRGGPGAIILEKGVTLSGVTWTRSAELPRTNYEITLEAMKLEGEDFFCGLTFPVGASACTFIVGGWGGMVVGLSSVDHFDASDNETSQGMEFKDNRWYRIRVKVTDTKIEAWIDDTQMVDLETAGKKITLRWGEIQRSLPLGVAAFMTRAALRDIRLRRL